MQPVKSIFRHRIRLPTVYFKEGPLPFYPAPTDPLFDEGSAPHADKALNNASPPLFDPFAPFSMPCGALVGESMKTSPEKNASFVVMTYIFLADGTF